MAEQEVPKTAEVLARWRGGRRLSKQRLAELSDVSATYVRIIEAGIDDDGRTVVPSAGVIRKLAAGLSGGDPEEERRAYAELMTAAGYLEPLAPDAPGGPAAPVTVALRDPRLHGACRRVLARWETLSPEDQALLLGIMEFVERRRT